MKKKVQILLLSIITITLLTNFAIASDVAYIYKNEKKIDQKIIDEFTASGLEVDLINIKNLPIDFSSYRLIYVGNERFSKRTQIPIDKHPSIIVNRLNTKQLGLTDKTNAKKLTSNMPSKINKAGEIVSIYEPPFNPLNKRKSRGIYYYLDNRVKVSGATQIAGTYTGNPSYIKGDVVSHIPEGIELTNSKTTEDKICFFGIFQAEFWTQEAKDLFKECIDFVTSSSPPIPPISTIHDIALVDFASAINNIRLEHVNGTDILENTLLCNEKYKIGIKVQNNGDFIENITFMGSVDSIDVDHLPKENLEPGDSTIKTKTINFSLAPGNYTIMTEAFITNPDATPLDNMAMRDITIVCPQSDPEPTPLNETETMNETEMEPASTHDIALVNFTSAINNIRLEHKNGTDILEGESLMCSQEYKIGIKVENLGDFHENITYTGSINGLNFSHNPTTNLAPGETSLKTKTVNFTLHEGSHIITVEAHIQDIDETPLDNIASRNFEIICLGELS